MPRIIDCHVHSLADSQVDYARELGYDKVCLIEFRAEVLEQALRKHPDFVLGVGWLPLDKDIPSSLRAIDQFRDLGCRGYKICFTNAPYDDELFYPVYEKIQACNMPVFFHTGWLYQQLCYALYPNTGRPKAEYYSPMRLDRLALDFPRLRMVAYHFGGTHASDCALLMSNPPNIYADTCRNFEPFDHFNGQIGGNTGTVFGKLVVGTDGMQSRQKVAERIQGLQRLMDHFQLGAGLRDRIWYKTALRILGMDEELKRAATARKAAGPVNLETVLQNSLNLPAASGFVDRLGEKVQAETRCHIGYTSSGVQFSFFCQDPKPSALAISQNPPLGQLWQDDCVEIFIAPKNDGSYYHVVASAGGRALIQSGRYGDAQELPAQARIGAQGWATTVELPFTLLKSSPDGAQRWGLNLCRNKVSAPSEASSWNEVASTFHDVSGFGRLKFE